MHFSLLSLGEILKGITVLAVSKRRDGVQEWLDGTLHPRFEDRILPVTAPSGALGRSLRRMPIAGKTGQGR
jgi:hypothetical protein